MPLVSFEDAAPQVDPSVFIASTGQVVGQVTIGEGASVWYDAVLRGDLNTIVVGARSNVQDQALIHVSRNHPVVVGSDVTVGHRVVLHGCEIGDNVLLGIGAIVLDGARVGSDCLVAASAVVPEGAEIPPGSLVMGVPGSVRRALRDEEIEAIRGAADHQMELVERYRATL